MRLDYTIEGYWLARRRDLSPHTVDDYERTFSRLMDALGPDREFEGITATDIHGFLNQYAHLAGKTQSNIWTALSALWTWAEMELGVPHAIRGRVRRPSYRRAMVDPYTAEETLALLDACERAAAWSTDTGRQVRSKRPSAQRDRAIMLVLLDSGVRVSELCNLRMVDYNQNRGTLAIEHGKGDKERTVFLGTVAQRAIWKYLGERESVAEHDPLFVNGAGRALNRHTVQKMIARAGERAGVSGASPHRFRHTFAISYLRNGGNVLELQKLLGHENLSTVRIYADLAETDLAGGHRRASPADRLGI